jgi:SAM-dependent methyltransferase
MPEFTGERLVPGQVDADLWNEHLARYLFAKRLARHKRVLDIACGHGYGSAELAQVAEAVTGVDVSEEAVEAAALAYRAPNLRFQAAAAQSLPFEDAAFQLITAFEVIEHLEDWERLLAEARRLLAPGGQFIVSTPNRRYYAETRRQSGPNPFHVHEFEFEEFDRALAEHFSSVRMYLQNHVEAIAFEPLTEGHVRGELLVELGEKRPEESHFFVAVCANSTQTAGPTFVHLPAASNVLREREHHIGKLEDELRLKDQWLEKLKNEHAALASLHTQQLEEMRLQAEWAGQLQEEIERARQQLAAQEEQLRREGEARAALEAGLDELRLDNSRLNEELKAKVSELAAAVELLHQAESTVEERTEWARSLTAKVEELETAMRVAGSSRWVRLGRRIGVGPVLPTE